MTSYFLADYVAIAALGILSLAQWIRRDFFSARRMRSIAVLLFIAIAGTLAYYSYRQFSAWRVSEVMRYALPPYQSWAYFLGYIVGRFWAWYLISAALAFIFFGIAVYANRRSANRFFYPEEPYFLLLGIFLVNHPLWILYSAAALLFYLGASALHRLRSRGAAEKRFSFYYGWLPTALIIILAKPYLLAIPFIEQLIVAKP